MAAAVYFLGFAQVSYSGVSVSGAQGQAPLTTSFSGHEPWRLTAEPLAIAFLLSLTIVMVVGGLAAWRGVLGMTIACALLALVASYISGFSIGLLYLPGALALTLSAALLAIDSLRRPP
jgi:cell division protein FtsW (lipid II flippase)